MQPETPTRKPPCVYRHMQSKWVQEFWETGSLKIGSFQTNAEHPDSNLRDTEGRAYFRGYAGDVRVSSIAYAANLSHYRSLSTSYLCTPKVAALLGADDYFEIHDLIGFADHVAEIIGARTCIFGPSWYGARVGAGEIDEPVPYFGEGRRPGPDEAEAAGRALQEYAQRNFAARALFSKEERDAGQAEFRFLWDLGGPVSCNVYPIIVDRERYCSRRRGS